MIVENELLGYPRLKIYQDENMFHFSIDSILLANFASIKTKSNKVLDFCSGNCPIPLYLTLRTEAHIDAIEIQKEPYELGINSIKANNLEERIDLIHGDVKEATKLFEPNSYDLVTCNPPFFKIDENSNLNKNDYLTIARHEVKLTLDEMVSVASKMLKDGGFLSITYPPTRLQEVFLAFEKYGINATRLQMVYPKRGRKANHCLIEGRKNKGKNKNLIILNPLYIYQRNDKWTKDILKIYNYGMVSK